MIVGGQAIGCESLLRHGAEMLRHAGIPSSRREARLLLACTLGVSPDQLVASRMHIPEREADSFFKLVGRRCKHEPLAYITGVREFWSLDFQVRPGVLIPRPESELLIEAALDRFGDKPIRVLDLGTGSGCLLLAFLSERQNATGLGVDWSETALEIAATNARALSLSARAEFYRSDWCTDVRGSFDVVLANPPYVGATELAHLPVDVRQFEPVEALNGGEDGLGACRRIASGLPRVLSTGGYAFIEIGQGQANSVPSIFETTGLIHDGTLCDLAGIPRCVILRAG